MAWVIHHPYTHTNQITSNTGKKTLFLSSSALSMSPLLCPQIPASRHLLWCMELAMLSWCQHLGTGLQPPHISTILILTKAVTLSLSSPTSAPTPGITHPKPKSASTSSTAGRWAASHSQTNPHQTDTRENKNWFTGNVPCTIMNEWLCNSGTERGMSPNEGRQVLSFCAEARLCISSFSFPRYKPVRFFLVLVSGFVWVAWDRGLLSRPQICRDLTASTSWVLGHHQPG